MNLESLTRAEREELLLLLGERHKRAQQRKLFTYYPETGPLRRELYPKHMAFFRAGAVHRERLILAANRVGKTEGIGGFETTLHLTGRYPPWWEGRRFDRPIRAWAAGKTNETTRDIIQAKLFGSVLGSDRRSGWKGRGSSLAKISATCLGSLAIPTCSTPCSSNTRLVDGLKSA